MLALAIGLFFAGAPAAADNPAATTPAAVQPVDPDAQRRICRKEMATGTRFEKRVCRTKAEWDELREKSRQAAQEEINRPAINPASNGG